MPFLYKNNFKNVTNMQRVGKDLKLSCQFAGVPKPSVVWYKNKRRNPDHSSIIHHGDSLLIKSMKTDDSGTYKCVGVNNVGSSDEEMIIDVQEYSVILESDFSVFFLIGGIGESNNDKNELQTLTTRKMSKYEISNSDVPAEEAKTTTSNNNSSESPHEMLHDELNTDNSYGSTAYSKKELQTSISMNISKDQILNYDVPAEDPKTTSNYNDSSESSNEMQHDELNTDNCYGSTAYNKKELQTSISKNISKDQILNSDVTAEDPKTTSNNNDSSESSNEKLHDELNTDNCYGSTAYKPLSCLKGNTMNQQNKLKASESLTLICETYEFPESHLEFTKILVSSHIGSHQNVVKLLGLVVRAISTAEFMEYCKFGNLLHFMQRYKNTFINEIDHISERITSIDLESSNFLDFLGRSLTTTKLISWSHQIASGMIFLSSSVIIHGDLASRNILLCERNLVKICDFGLSKIKKESNYYTNLTRTMPMKWVALESFREGTFSTYTDVWSYGVVLWEIFSLGEEPYKGIGFDTLSVQLSNGFRLGKTKFATENLYILMRRCWHVDPRARPCFPELEQEIGRIIITEQLVTEINKMDEMT
ncbi:Mitogen-activated protein kinase kinase kinase [Sergentomyia squamirostris]